MEPCHSASSYPYKKFACAGTMSAVVVEANKCARVGVIVLEEGRKETAPELRSIRTLSTDQACALTIRTDRWRDSITGTSRVTRPPFGSTFSILRSPPRRLAIP